MVKEFQETMQTNYEENEEDTHILYISNLICTIELFTHILSVSIHFFPMKATMLGPWSGRAPRDTSPVPR